MKWLPKAMICHLKSKDLIKTETINAAKQIKEEGAERDGSAAGRTEDPEHGDTAGAGGPPKNKRKPMIPSGWVIF